MFKKAKIVMLPTNEKADIPKGQLYLKSNKKGNIDDSLVNSKLAIASKYLDYEDRQNIIFCAGGDVYLKSQHLYILSDEKIKEGDWCIGNDKIHVKSPDEFFIAQCTSVVNGWIYLEGHEGEGNNPDYTKKIIATTNTSLKFGEDVPGIIRYKTLPSPSQSFIEKYVTEYNKGNVITDVLVEYEAIGNWRHAAFVHTQDIPKVSKDNTITIKKVKDSWSRDEVEEIYRTARNKPYEETKAGFDLIDIVEASDKWIEENL